jgi:hypothetical protein
MYKENICLIFLIENIESCNIPLDRIDRNSNFKVSTPNFFAVQ